MKCYRGEIRNVSTKGGDKDRSLTLPNSPCAKEPYRSGECILVFTSWGAQLKFSTFAGNSEKPSPITLRTPSPRKSPRSHNKLDSSARASKCLTLGSLHEIMPPAPAVLL